VAGDDDSDDRTRTLWLSVGSMVTAGQVCRRLG